MSTIKFKKIIKLCPQNIAILSAVFLYCTAFLINDLGFSITVYAGAIGCICIGCFVLKLGVMQRISFNWKISFIVISQFITFITSFNNYDLHDNTKTYYLIISIIAFLAFATTDYSSSNADVINKLVLYTGIIFATLIYIYKLLPTIYRSLIFPCLTDETVSTLNFVTSQGYSIFVYGDISYTLTLILFAIYIALFTDVQRPKIKVAIYLMFSILISQRRTELIFGFITIIFSYICFYHRIFLVFIKKHILIFLMILGISGGLVLSIGIFLATVPPEYSSSSRMLMTLYDLRYRIDTSNGRNILYQIAKRLLEKHWIYGLGWMNFSHYAGESNISMVRNVHNIYLQLILECGFFFGGIFIFCMFGLMMIFFHAAYKTHRSGAGGAILMYILLAGLTDNTIYYPYFWIILWSAAYISGITQITHQNGGHV